MPIKEKLRRIAFSAVTAFAPAATTADQSFFMPDETLIDVQENLAKTGASWQITASDFENTDTDSIDRLVCYDKNNNGIADRNISYSRYVNGREVFEYGEVAYTRQSITAKTVDFYFDGTRERYADMQTLSAYFTMQELNQQGRSGVAVVYSQHESREINGVMPIAYVISSTSSGVTMAKNPNWDDLRTANQEYCDTLIIPKVGAPG